MDGESSDGRSRTWRPVFFHNFPGKDSDGDELVAEVALRTSAAPTYFPSHGVYVDGGVVANNPSMAALAQARDQKRTTDNLPQLNEIALLSLGTGGVLNYISGADHDWGLAQWAQALVNLFMDASMGIADFQCQRLLEDKYFRAAPVFLAGEDIKVDDWERAADLLNVGKGYPDLPKTLGWLKDVGW